VKQALALPAESASLRAAFALCAGLSARHREMMTCKPSTARPGVSDRDIPRDAVHDMIRERLNPGPRPGATDEMTTAG
jgi:hypothetical protein